MPPDLPALSARLRAAEAATADDALPALCRTFAGHDDARAWLFELGGDPRVSIDAALALVRAVEPALGLEIYTGRDGSRVRTVSAEHIGEWLSCATLPLALCLALVEWKVKHG